MFMIDGDEFFAVASLAALAIGIGLNRAAPVSEAGALGISPALVDLGAVVPGDRPAALFQLSNRTKETMTITGVNADCGCTEPKADRTSIGPGGVATVTAVLDTSNLRGPVERHIVIQYTLPGEALPRQRILTIRAAVNEALVARPRSIDFDLGMSQTAELQIVVATTLFGIHDAYATHAAVSILRCTAGSVPSGREQAWNLTIGFDASKCDPHVPFRCAIVIPSSMPHEPDFRVPIQILTPRYSAAQNE